MNTRQVEKKKRLTGSAVPLHDSSRKKPVEAWCFAQAFFTPEHTDSISSNLNTFSPGFRVKQVIHLTAASPSSACWRGYNPQKLHNACWGARRGVHGHCKPTPSRPPCSFHPHQPAAPLANKSTRLTLYTGTHLVRAAAGAARLALW